jgi:uncharacterized protein
MEDGAIRQRLAAALSAALKGRDKIAASALRSALAAIDNTSAVPVAPAPAPGTGSPHFAGALAGLGAAEAQRRYLSEADTEEIVRTEVADRLTAALTYEQAGHRDQAERLRQEADVLIAVIGPASPSRAREAGNGGVGPGVAGVEAERR